MIFKGHRNLRQKVAELLVIRASGHCSDSERNYPLWELNNNDLERLLNDGVGGVIVFGGSTTELQIRCKTFKNWAINPLLICADIEEGLGQRFSGGTWLAPPMALGQIYGTEPFRAIHLAERYGKCTGMQARSCGLNWILGPVCDINTNPNNPVINLRAWGDDLRTVSALTCAFQRGLTSQGVLSCVKHFPGHGDTGVDSHLELPIVDHPLQRLEALEFLPFQAAISNGAASVMTAHLLIRNVDPDYPATLSKKVLTGLLRQKLGFEGLIVTDALVMESISKKYGCGESSVLAFAAGADLIMMPEDPFEAIEALCEALLSGRIPMERLEQALSRRNKAIAKLEFTSVSEQAKVCDVNVSQIESESDRLFARELVTNSLVIHNPGVIKAQPVGVNLLRVDSFFSNPFLTRSAPAICFPAEAGFRNVLCHEFGVSPWRDDAEEPLALHRIGDGNVLVQLFIRGNPFRGSGHLEEPWSAALRQLERCHRLAGLVVYGSPYVWEDLIQYVGPHIPAAYSPAQIPEAQRQILKSFFPAPSGLKRSSKKLRNEFTD